MRNQISGHIHNFPLLRMVVSVLTVIAIKLSGLTIGEIGPRLGINSQDNGFLSFHYFRIPRTNMLMKFSQVTEVRNQIIIVMDDLCYNLDENYR